MCSTGYTFRWIVKCEGDDVSSLTARVYLSYRNYLPKQYVDPLCVYIQR